MDRLIARQKEETGAYPESIAIVLWGTDNIKTYGESLAQVTPRAQVPVAPQSVYHIRTFCAVEKCIDSTFLPVSLTPAGERLPPSELTRRVTLAARRSSGSSACAPSRTPWAA